MTELAQAEPLRAPFSWFGGKSRAASLIWERFGNTPNYVEPFAGSLAVLLARPHEARIETVNDRDAYIANFWRAVRMDPEAVAAHADWPVNESDLHARHKWLLAQADFRERMATDPEFYDARIAGWWVWGLCAWIGDGWCQGAESSQIPHLGDAGPGLHRPSRQVPHLASGGRGVHRSRQIPVLKGAGDGVHAIARTFGAEVFAALSARLRRVRVCCGEWDRVLGPTPTVHNGLTAVLLDPPYAEGEAHYTDDRSLSARVREWAVANGENPGLRIALCGYDGEHELPESWARVAWKNRGGYGNKSATNENRHRETIWFSPHCLSGRQRGLFEVTA